MTNEAVVIDQAIDDYHLIFGEGLLIIPRYVLGSDASTMQFSAMI